MSLPTNNGAFIHKGYNCSSMIIPSAQSIPLTPTDSTTVYNAIISKQNITDNALSTTDKTIVGAINELYSNKVNTSDLAIVAFSGSYNDLSNTPNVAEIDDSSTANNKAWSASKIGTDLGGKVSKSGDTMSGQLSFSNTSRNIQIPARSTSYVDGAKGNAGIYMPHTYNKDEWGPIFCVQNKAGGSWSVGSYNGEDLEFVNFTKANIDSNTNTARCNWKLSPTNGFVGPWNGITMEMGTNNTSNTWVPVQTGSKWQHRVIPTAYNNAPWTSDAIVSLNGYSDTTVPSTRFMAYWNGAYNNSGNSNLRYTAAGDLLTYEQSYTRNNGNVSYTENLRCWRSGKVVTLGGYFSCGTTLGANTTLYTVPAAKFITYFTAKHEGQNRMYNFNLRTDGQIRTNEQIVSGTYLVTLTYVCT